MKNKMRKYTHNGVEMVQFVNSDNNTTQTYTVEEVLKFIEGDLKEEEK